MLCDKKQAQKCKFYKIYAEKHQTMVNFFLKHSQNLHDLANLLPYYSFLKVNYYLRTVKFQFQNRTRPDGW